MTQQIVTVCDSCGHQMLGSSQEGLSVWVAPGVAQGLPTRSRWRRRWRLQRAVGDMDAALTFCDHACLAAWAFDHSNVGSRV